MTAENNIIIECLNLQVNAIQRQLITNLSWQIRADEFWAVTGANGSGKTVLSSLIAGKRMPVKGSITYHFPQQAPINADSALPSRPTDLIAQVSFDASTLFRGFHEMYYQRRYNQAEEADLPSVHEFIQSKIKAAGASATFSTTLTAFFNSTLLERKINQLSNGETKKLLVLLSLLNSPYLIILDQPFTGLDEANRHQLYLLLDELRASGYKIILICREEELPPAITHILNLEKQEAISYTAEEFGQRMNAVRIAGREDAPDAAPADSAPGIKNTRAAAQLAGLSASGLSASGNQLAQASGNRSAQPAGLGTAALSPIKFPRPETGSADFKTAVSMRNVGIAYGAITILTAINWEILKGERWVLTGPNGSGKSTLLSLIYGDHPQAYAQDLHLFDRKRGSGESIWDIKKKIGFLSPEMQVFFPRDQSTLKTILSGLSDTMGLFRRATAPETDLAMELMECLGITELADMLFRQLSTGEQRLVLLARALIKNPPLLILDEPCQGLDAHHRNQFISLVDQLCTQADKTLIYVSHYQEDFPACASLEFSLPGGVVKELTV